ncbi:HD domain-containing protein [Photorhabdus luminescens]|uniref:HD domain-containing protein n=1 Tax=Photorhabdus luminescens subsp. sonorensis TaxID=1173677 RepID=A0A5C4RIG5_PHOLU|nr:HD domain-containing protein [Photorhabdus luminescens]TNH43872.1 HD domain-containing protein [Photorhabdus luminescens subsp. sonorensis]
MFVLDNAVREKKIEKLLEIEKHISRSWHYRSLGGKTQFIPYHFRSSAHYTRIKHTNDVINCIPLFGSELDELELCLCRISGMLHDIGYPPFGHSGERVLNGLMSGHGGFESNAQSVRIACQYLELPSLISSLCIKYNYVIPIHPHFRNITLFKGVYESESFLLTLSKDYNLEKLKTVVNYADEISYTVSDIKDMVIERGDAILLDSYRKTHYLDVCKVITEMIDKSAAEIASTVLTQFFFDSKGLINSNAFQDFTRCAAAISKQFLIEHEYATKEDEYSRQILSCLFESLIQRRQENESVRDIVDLISSLTEQQTLTYY